MSLSTSIINLPTATAVQVTSQRYDPAAFVAQPASYSLDPKTGVIILEQYHTFPSASLDYPTYAIVRITVNPRDNGGNGKTTYSQRVTTWAETVDSVTGLVIDRKKVEAVVSWNVEGVSGIPAPSDLMKLITGCYGLCYGLTGSPAAPDTTRLVAMAQRSTDI